MEKNIKIILTNFIRYCINLICKIVLVISSTILLVSILMICLLEFIDLDLRSTSYIIKCFRLLGEFDFKTAVIETPIILGILICCITYIIIYINTDNNNIKFNVLIDSIILSLSILIEEKLYINYNKELVVYIVFLILLIFIILWLLIILFNVIICLIKKDEVKRQLKLTLTLIRLELLIFIIYIFGELKNISIRINNINLLKDTKNYRLFFIICILYYFIAIIIKKLILDKIEE